MAFQSYFPCNFSFKLILFFPLHYLKLHNETVEDDQECKNSESKDRVEDKLKICHKKRKRSNIQKKSLDVFCEKSR